MLPVKGCDRGEIDVRRVEIMAAELDIPRERIIKWGLVLALIWARWSADTPEEFWRTSIQSRSGVGSVALDDVSSLTTRRFYV